MFDDVPLVLVQDAEALAATAQVLGRERAVALDTEADSLHHYQEKVCLVQVSIPSCDYVIDPLAVPDLSPLAPLLGNPAIVKVLHGADYDVVSLKRDHGLQIRGLFDTMIAASFLGLPGVGLADVLAGVFQVELDKRLQRHDWAARPLEADHLHYARGDTHWLLPLREVLVRRLGRVGRLEAVEEECRRIEDREWHPRADADTAFLRVKGASALDPAARRVLRKLWAWREEQARRLDRPVFKVVPDRVLIGVARRQPSEIRELAPVVRLSSALVRQHGDGLVACVAEGLADVEPLPEPRARATVPRIQAAPAAPTIAERLKSWRKARAEQPGSTQALLPSNAVIREIAQVAPRSMEALGTIPGVRHWQVEAWGEEVLGIIRDCIVSQEAARTGRRRRKRAR
ncbi:MAG: ribonuclease D [Deltaproteobacteria bacterium]|nr:ribonuclease D [Deltaproteobacteria bacterium]